MHDACRYVIVYLAANILSTIGLTLSVVPVYSDLLSISEYVSEIAAYVCKSENITEAPCNCIIGWGWWEELRYRGGGGDV